MYIRCSKRFLKEMRKYQKVSVLPPEAVGDGAGGLYIWSVSVTVVNRKKTVVFENERVRNLVVLHNLTGRDWRNLEALFLEGLRVSLEEEGILPEVIETYLSASGPIFYGEIPDRSGIARIAWAGRDAGRFPEFYDAHSVVQRRGALSFNDRFLKMGEGRYENVHDRLLSELCILLGLLPSEGAKIRKIKTYLLRIRMNLKGHSAERFVKIPASATFHTLHRAVMITFGWKDAHFHEFTVFDETKPFFPLEPFCMWPIQAYIVEETDPQLFDFYDPSRYEIYYESYTRLYEIFDHVGGLVYTYDMADTWEHIITLEDILENGEEHPVLVKRIGTRPPENVGGAEGYAEYLRVVNDPDNPDYERVRFWAESQKEQEKTMEELNRRLRIYIR